MDILQIIEYAKYVQQPNYQYNHNHGIQNSFNGALHWNERIDKPENYSNDNNYKENSEKWHRIKV
jgi:hypothetical protein